MSLEVFGIPFRDVDDLEDTLMELPDGLLQSTYDKVKDVKVDDDLVVDNFKYYFEDMDYQLKNDPVWLSKRNAIITNFKEFIRKISRNESVNDFSRDSYNDFMKNLNEIKTIAKGYTKKSIKNSIIISANLSFLDLIGFYEDMISKAYS